MSYFLSCDWGTSNFRLRLIDVNTEEIIEEVHSGQGSAAVYKEWIESNQPNSNRIKFYQKILTEAISQLNTNVIKGTPLIISGMASSSIGIQELPYLQFPFNLIDSKVHISKIDVDSLFLFPIYLISGYRTDRDIMRGEETILLGGFVSENNDGVYILPGTHSKHVLVTNGIATEFRTYITGELFNLLVKNSIISNSVESGNEPESFLSGIRDAQTINILSGIFSIRVRHLLNESTPVQNYQYLSGLIIGTELKEIGASIPCIYIIGENPLLQLYVDGLATLGIGKKINILDAKDSFIKGHCKIYRNLELSC